MLAPCARSVSGRWASWSPCSSPERSGLPSRRTSRPSARCPPARRAPRGWVLAAGVPGRAVGAAAAHRPPLGVRREGRHRAARRRAEYANALRGVFRVLYDEGFRIRHMRLADSYGPKDAGRRAMSADRSRVVGPFRPPAARGRATGRTTPTAARSTSTRSRTRTSAVVARATGPSRPYLDRSRTRPGMRHARASSAPSPRSAGGGAAAGPAHQGLHALLRHGPVGGHAPEKSAVAACDDRYDLRALNRQEVTGTAPTATAKHLGRPGAHRRRGLRALLAERAARRRSRHDHAESASRR